MLRKFANIVPFVTYATSPTCTAHAAAIRLIEAWNAHNAQQVVDLYHEACTIEDVGLATPIYGKEGVRRMYLYTIAGFSGLTFTLERCICNGSEVAMDWSAVGIQSRRMLGIPPTGRIVRFQGITLLSVKDGLIHHARRVWDMAGVLRQVGLLPDLPDLTDSKR